MRTSNIAPTCNFAVIMLLVVTNLSILLTTDLLAETTISEGFRFAVSEGFRVSKVEKDHDSVVVGEDITIPSKDVATNSSNSPRLTLEVPHLFHLSPKLVSNLSSVFHYWSSVGNWHFTSKMGGKIQREMAKKMVKPTINNSDNTTLLFDWCIPQSVKYFRSRHLERQPVQGLIFSKSPKAASSTGSAVSIQIAQNVARRLNYTLPCASNSSHPFSSHRGPNRRIYPSLAFTNVRHPGKLALSMFYHFGATRLGSDTDDDSVIAWAEDLRGNQLKYIGGKGGDDPKRIQKQALELYDFVAIVERMEESLVAMKILWHLEHEDIIVLDSKVSGAWSLRDSKTCELIKPSVLTPRLKEYFENNHTKNNIDYLLYAVINATLDRTIEKTIGQELFMKELRIHQRLKALALQDCPPEDYSPCTKEGVFRTDIKCLQDDMGCSYECVQQSILKNKQAVVSSSIL